MNIKIIFLLLCTVTLAGCPRVAYIDIYNNTFSAFLIDSHGEKYSVKPNQSVRLTLGYSWQIESELGTWIYERNVPDGGAEGKFFDGTLVVQVNTDGKIYVAKKGDELPLSIVGYEQPEGYPLLPNSKLNRN